MSSVPRQPFIVGLGGTIRAGSSTERALALALRGAEAKGARTEIIGGEMLAGLPLYNPYNAAVTEDQARLIETVREADGLIIASPGYHGSISGVVKNALDTLEMLRGDARPYLSGRAIGCVITADGWQAAGTTLTALRSIIHALRGWPTPLGAALNASVGLFDEAGECRDAKDAWQLAAVADQVLEFATMKAGA